MKGIMKISISKKDLINVIDGLYLCLNLAEDGDRVTIKRIERLVSVLEHQQCLAEKTEKKGKKK